VVKLLNLITERRSYYDDSNIMIEITTVTPPGITVTLLRDDSNIKNARRQHQLIDNFDLSRFERDGYHRGKSLID
jgi:hypothetical protein